MEGRLDSLLADLDRATEAARHARAVETAARRAVVAEGRRLGMSLREIAKLMGLSHQRVAKIERDLER